MVDTAGWIRLRFEALEPGRAVPLSRRPDEGAHAGAISRHLGRHEKHALVKTGKELVGDFKNGGQELRPKDAYHITLMLKLLTE